MLLFDQNISFRILNLLKNDFPNVEQVRSIGMEGAKDMEIWHFAKENNFAIVSFDADFTDIAYLKGFPPKIIWLRTGNKSTRGIADLFLRKKEIILVLS